MFGKKQHRETVERLEEKISALTAKLVHAEASLVASRMYTESLVQDRQVLQDQISKLQEALVAAASPEIYREKVQQALDPQVRESLDREHQVNLLLQRYAARIEDDAIIKSHEDMEALMRIAGIPEPGRVAPNSES